MQGGRGLVLQPMCRLSVLWYCARIRGVKLRSFIVSGERYGNFTANLVLQ